MLKHLILKCFVKMRVRENSASTTTVNRADGKCNSTHNLSSGYAHFQNDVGSQCSSALSGVS